MVSFIFFLSQLFFCHVLLNPDRSFRTIFASIIIEFILVVSNEQFVNNEYPEAACLFILVVDVFLGLL